MSAVEFRSVAKVYRAKRVIDGLSLMIEAGERVVLFGPSGCGKSTTLLLIAGLVAPDAGEIRLARFGRTLVSRKTSGSGFARGEWQRPNVEGASMTSPTLSVSAIICTFGRANFRGESNSVSRWRELLS
jgi:energy-coupling factor transporter ATP-binding protein EcfA2